MSRHARPDPDAALPEIPQAPDSSPGAEERRRRSPYASQPPPAPAPAPFGEPAGAGEIPGAPDSAGVPSPDALPQVAKPPLDPVSIAAVATGAVGLGPVAVVLGGIGLRRTTRSWLRSPVIAGIGLVLGILGTLGWAGLAAAFTLGAFEGPNLTATPGDVSAPVTVHASALAAGNCVETLPPQQDVGELRLVPCDDPHLAQVLAVADFPADRYPGSEPALEAGTEWCSGILTDEGFHAESFLAWAIVPSPAAWDADVRTMSCLARSTMGLITGDLS